VDLKQVYHSWKDYGQRVTLTKSSYFIEYMKLHKLSLIQDMQAIEEHEVTHEGYPKEYLQGAIACMDHLLSVATDIMKSSNERYNNDNI
jgi:hypothetical protein